MENGNRADKLALSALPAGATPISREQMKMMVNFVMQNPDHRTADVLGDVSLLSFSLLVGHD
jgi:hypothetical protein